MTLLETNFAIRIAVGGDDDTLPLRALLDDTALATQVCATSDDLLAYAPSVIVLDKTLSKGVGLAWIRAHLPDVAVLAPTALEPTAEFPLPETPNVQLQLVKTACELYLNRQQARSFKQLALSAEGDLVKLGGISVALSAERDLDKLLERVLEAAQEMACCDAASIFLLDNNSGNNQELIFKLTRNDSVELPFSENRFDVSDASISGYVALTGESVHCEDVYMMGPEQPFRFNRDFDERAGYRTRGLYCVPMINHDDTVVGVLQVINRKHSRSERISPANVDSVVIEFDEQARQSMDALASLSAVAIQTRMLVDSVNQLFEDFVNASVAAIEQRDPTTSGHSFRVADLSVALAQALPTAKRSDLARFDPTPARLRELRYAALLHDFGKVGVREHVLMKAKKLYDWELTELNYRLALARQTLRADSAEEIIRLYERGNTTAKGVASIRERAHNDAKQLDQFLATVIRANEPSLLSEDCKENLEMLETFHCLDAAGQLTPLLTRAYSEALSMAKGSLTPSERHEIESHVVHTHNFLKMIPWTNELAGIPDIAGRHHEKLDGTGYPDRLMASDIPLQSRVMTVCDIFDALTATDRPYKKAAPDSVAFRILREEAHNGMLDRDIVELFIGSDVPAVSRGKAYPRIASACDTGLSHSVCDPDTHAH